MSGHVHLDAIQMLYTAASVFLVAHAMRMIGAYIANHGADTFGKAIGSFFTLNA